MLFRVVFDVAQRPSTGCEYPVAGVFVAMGVLGLSSREIQKDRFWAQHYSLSLVY